jgi:hypothetical protein
MSAPGRSTSGQSDPARGSAGPVRKPYQKLSFRFEQVLETMALVCGKISPTQPACNFVKKNS